MDQETGAEERDGAKEKEQQENEASEARNKAETGTGDGQVARAGSWDPNKGEEGRDLSKGDLGRLGGKAGVNNQGWKPGRERMNIEMGRERSTQGKGEDKEERSEGVRTSRGKWDGGDGEERAADGQKPGRELRTGAPGWFNEPLSSPTSQGKRSQLCLLPPGQEEVRRAEEMPSPSRTAGGTGQGQVGVLSSQEGRGALSRSARPPLQGGAPCQPGVGCGWGTPMPLSTLALCPPGEVIGERRP